MKALVLGLSLISAVASANSGDYANWGPPPPKPIPSRSGSGTACGPFEINDFGPHQSGQTSLTIWTKIKARPDLGYLNVEFSSAEADAFDDVYKGQCVCLDYTWASAPVDDMPGMEKWDFEPASNLRACPLPAHRVAPKKKPRRK